MADEKTLERQRTRVMESVNRIKSFATSADATTPLEGITVWLVKLDELWLEFCSVEDSLLQNENQSSQLELFERLYYDAKVLLMQHLKTLKDVNNESQPSPQGDNTESNTTSQGVNAESNQNTSDLNETVGRLVDQQRTFFETFGERSYNQPEREIRLPRLNIPPFGGNYSEWPSFKDLFEASVHKNDKLTDSQKFQYLKGLLKADAAAIVKHLTVTDTNYKEAWEKLNKRFNKRKQIATTLLKTFLEQSAISTVTAKSLRQLADTSDEVIRGLRALGSEAELRDPWLIYIVLGKLDSETRQLWAQSSAGKDFPTFQEFLDFLSTRCDSLESCSFSTRKFLVNKNNVQIKSLHTATSDNQLCPKCNGSHNLYHCSEFKSLDVSGRRAFVSQHHVCFNCLHKGHSVFYCRIRNTCHYCGKKHHSLLHINNNTPSSSNKHASSLHATPDYIQINTQATKSSSINNNPPNPSFNSNTSINSTSINPKTSFNRISSHPATSINTQSHLSTQSEIPTLQSNSLAQFRYSNQPQTEVKNKINLITASLLPTAIIHVLDSYGNICQCRALLDSGSQVSLISESCTQRLQLPRSNARISVSSIASTGVGITRGQVTIDIVSPIDSSRILELNAYVMSKLTSFLPSFEFDCSKLEYFKSLRLADPSFNTPGKIDIIIGADKFFDILQCGKILGPDGFPIAFNSIFGWVVAGDIRQLASDNDSIVSLHTNIDCTLRRFWELEETHHAKNIYTNEEMRCEEHYSTHVCRQNNGQYTVSLPFKEDKRNFGNSYNNALYRLKSLEKRFSKDETLRQQYTTFMKEYLAMGHMELIPDSEIPIGECNSFYLPHHAVVKQTSSTTKLRVVFDGSCKSSSGVALNDTLMVGPTIQKDLRSILIKFRQFKIAYTADVEKMYRMVRVSPSDCDYQRILWRENPSLPVKHYRLTTVTYGTSAAPFLAIRTLHEIAKNNNVNYPKASSVILNDFYVDDLLSGANNLSEALTIRSDLINVLNSAGFHLRKWVSNSSLLMDKSEASNVYIDDNQAVKILGVEWNPREDIFLFRVSLPDVNIITKRQILSEVSRLFDPLGWLSPTIISAKILLQQLWLSNTDWDDPLPDSVLTKWTSLRKEFTLFTKVKIQRWLKMDNMHQGLQLHCFSDASEMAYAAVIYSRVVDSHGQVHVTLITSSTKVAPIKQITLPRLELCGALLLTRLVLKVKDALNITNEPIIAWTDSSIVLSWLSDHPRRWKTFVGNRTAEILDAIPRSNWKHISSSENPADCASRGLLPHQLIASKLWWQGPPWLVENPTCWPNSHSNSSPQESSSQIQEEERKRFFNCHVHIENDTLQELISNHSSWIKIIRILCYCKRLMKKTRISTTKFISTVELNEAKNIIFKWVQQNAFAEEITNLKARKDISHRSQLLSLTPFLDEHGILRVGGRLQNSEYSFNKKHPIILPKGHRVCILIAEEYHKRFLHAGPSLLINIIRQEYWVISVRSLVKGICNKCISCYRQRATASQQLMGNLPHDRVTPSRPFSRSGVDYAGPFSLLTRKGRGAKTFKSYIALFVCLATKAIHLELVTDITADAFIAALRRFIARRGYPTDIYSDNGTNFVGANRKLCQFHAIFLSEQNAKIISNFSLDNNINWHFNPPGAPHFGGLWEAGIKSTKTHIRKVVGDTRLTFEEMTTLLCQIEAMLNSRPLQPINADTDSLDVLTPAHFLVGDILTALPASSADDGNMSLVSRWHLVQRISQHFWKRWQRDYLATLQQRSKWTQPKDSIRTGDIVIIKEETPPTKWAMGRITEVYPGQDGLVRVVKLKTIRGEIERPITKLCKLPIS